MRFGVGSAAVLDRAMRTEIGWIAKPAKAGDLSGRLFSGTFAVCGLTKRGFGADR